MAQPQIIQAYYGPAEETEALIQSATVEDAVYTPGTNDIANGTVTLTFTASDACGSTSDQITITINDEATAQAGSDASIC